MEMIFKGKFEIGCCGKMPVIPEMVIEIKKSYSCRPERFEFNAISDGLYFLNLA
jgi:hypothetical protein